MSCFVYLHIFPNEKIYVGTTQQTLEKRWGNGYGYKKQSFLWRAIQKYGWENVKHKVIVCETPEEMWEKEKELIEKYDTTNPEHGYNCSLGGESGALGVVRSEETRKKMSKSNKGKSRNKGIPKTEEHRKKISESMMGRKRPPFTEEHRRKIGEASKGRPSPQKNIPKTKYKWLTPEGEINYMDKDNAVRWHKDWTRIHYLDEAVLIHTNILISRGKTRFQGIIGNTYYFTFDGLFPELRQSLTQQYPEYMFVIFTEGEHDYIQGFEKIK